MEILSIDRVREFFLAMIGRDKPFRYRSQLAEYLYPPFPLTQAALRLPGLPLSSQLASLHSSWLVFGLFFLCLQWLLNFFYLFRNFFFTSFIFSGKKKLCLGGEERKPLEQEPSNRSTEHVCRTWMPL